MRQNFGDSGFRGHAVLSTKDFGLAVLNKFVGPADSFHRSGDDLIMKQFNNRKAKSIVEHVILKGTDDL